MLTGVRGMMWLVGLRDARGCRTARDEGLPDGAIYDHEVACLREAACLREGCACCA